MQFDGLIDGQAIEALGKLQKAMRVAFCGVMQSTRLPPMAAMNLAAMAVGSLYLEVAAVHQAHHGTSACQCGWEPRGASDVEALQSSLALAAAQPRPSPKAITIVGHA